MAIKAEARRAWRRCLSASIVWFVICHISPARAETLSIDTKTAQDIPIKLGAADLNLDISVKNSEAEDRQLLFGERIFRTGEQTSIGLKIDRRDTDNKNPDSKNLAKGSDARYSLSATLAEPGSYVTTLEIRNADGSQVLRKINFNITREGQSVPANLMIAPSALTVTWPWSALSQTPSVATVRLRNDTTKPISLSPAALLGLNNAEGAADLAGVKLEPDACPALMPAGTSCALKVTLGQSLWPGTYTLDVGVGGAAGGWSQQPLTISAGLSIIVAFVVAAAGLWVGVIADEWRKRGRPLVDTLIKLTTLKESLGKFTPSPSLETATALLKQDVERWLARFNDVPPDDAAITSLQSRYDRLVQANLLAGSLTRIGQAGQRTLQPRVSALIGRLTDVQLSDQQAGELASILNTIMEDLRNWPKAQGKADEANGILQTLGELAGRTAGDADCVAAIESLRKTIDDARVALQKPFAASLDDLSDTVAKRADAMADAIANLRNAGRDVAGKATIVLTNEINKIAPPRADLSEKLKAAAAKDWPDRLAAIRDIWQELAPSPAILTESAAVGSPSGVAIQDVQVDFLAGLWGKTAAQLREDRANNEWWWNVSIIGLFALGLAVGAINATWGSAADIAKLFLAGVGARLALAALTNR